MRHSTRLTRPPLRLAVTALLAAALAAVTALRPPGERPAYGQSVQAGLELLASNMAQRLVREGSGTLTLVIGDVPNLRGEYCALGRFVAERLTTQLATTKGLKVLERSTLAQALLEMKLAQADLADAEKAKQVGLRIGAEAVALGGLADLGTTVELDLRVIRLAGGETLFASYSAFAKSPGIEALAKQDCGRGTPPTSAAGGSPAIEPQENTGKAEKALSGNEPVYDNGAYRLRFEDVRKNGPTVSAQVLVENAGKEPVKFAIRNTSYLIDENGDRWDQVGSDSAAMWSWGTEFALTDLIPGTMLRTKLTFKSATGSNGGTVFTLIAKEYRPKEGRTVSVGNIRAQRDLVQPQ